MLDEIDHCRRMGELARKGARRMAMATAVVCGLGILLCVVSSWWWLLFFVALAIGCLHIVANLWNQQREHARKVKELESARGDS